MYTFCADWAPHDSDLEETLVGEGIEECLVPSHATFTPILMRLLEAGPSRGPSRVDAYLSEWMYQLDMHDTCLEDEEFEGLAQELKQDRVYHVRYEDELECYTTDHERQNFENRTCEKIAPSCQESGNNTATRV